MKIFLNHLRKFFEKSPVNPQLLILGKDALLFCILFICNAIFKDSFYRVDDNTDPIGDDNIYVKVDGIFDENF